MNFRGIYELVFELRYIIKEMNWTNSEIITSCELVQYDAKACDEWSFWKTVRLAEKARYKLFISEDPSFGFAWVLCSKKVASR